LVENGPSQIRSVAIYLQHLGWWLPPFSGPFFILFCAFLKSILLTFISSSMIPEAHRSPARHPYLFSARLLFLFPTSRRSCLISLHFFLEERFSPRGVFCLSFFIFFARGSLLNQRAVTLLQTLRSLSCHQRHPSSLSFSLLDVFIFFPCLFIYSRLSRGFFRAQNP